MDKLRLLIIEDDVDQRELLRETLLDHFGGATVVGAGGMKEALTHDFASFDLILSDYNMPDCSGMELLEEIRRRCNTPVIMVTGENVGNTAVEAIKRGATDYVVKLGDYLFTIPLIVEKNLTVAKVKRENEQLRSPGKVPTFAYADAERLDWLAGHWEFERRRNRPDPASSLGIVSVYFGCDMVGHDRRDNTLTLRELIDGGMRSEGENPGVKKKRNAKAKTGTADEAGDPPPSA